jgi:hypothetical protein
MLRCSHDINREHQIVGGRQPPSIVQAVGRFDLALHLAGRDLI